MRAWLTSERRQWLTAFCIAGVVLGLAFACCQVIYETNDDSSIVAVASGAVTGSPYVANGFTSYLYGCLLAGLFSVLPALPWHAILLVGTIYLSLAVLVKALLAWCISRNHSLFLAGALFLAVCLGVMLRYWTMLQFTTVPAMAVTAGCALMMAEQKKRLSTRGMALGLFLLAFLFRTASFWVAIPLWAVHELSRCFEKKSFARLWPCLGIIACFGALTLIDQALLQASDSRWAAFDSFNTYLGSFLDHHNTDETAEIAIHQLGWSPQMTYMLRNWYQLDARMTEDNLRQLIETVESNSPTLFSALYAAGSVLLRYPIFGFTLAGIGLFALYSLIRLICQKRWWAVLRMVGCGLYLLAFITYFYGFLNRLPLRAAFTCALPCCILLVMDCLEAHDRKPAISAKLLAICALALCCITPIAQGGSYLNLRWEKQAQDNTRQLSEAIVAYVSQEERQSAIYVTDTTLDLTPTYVYGDALPTNLISWDSGMYHSPLYQEKLERLGYPDGFFTENLLDEQVFLLLSSSSVLRNLLGYLEADFMPVICQEVDQGNGFSVYRLQVLNN